MIFVTGGTGLLGSRLLYDLTCRKEKIVALKRTTSDLNEVKKLFQFWDKSGLELFNKIEWRDGLLEDLFDVEEAMSGCTKVYHAAAVVSFHRKDDRALKEINILGTRNVVNAALHHNIEKICHVSSTAALGRVKSGQNINEKAEWKDSKLNSRYAKSKYESELQIWRGQEEGLPAVIVNPSVIIGPGTKGRSSGALFALVKNGLNYYPKGSNAYVALEDVSRTCMELMDSNIHGQRFLVAGENMEFRSLLGQIAEGFGQPKPSKEAKLWMLNMVRFGQGVREFFGGKRASVTKETILSTKNSYYYDSSKLKEALDFEFTPLTQAVNEAVAYYKI